MSLRRHDLEISSDKLRSDLEHLQQINSEHGERISSSLHALRREQEITDKLLREENWSPQAVDSQDRGKRHWRRGWTGRLLSGSGTLSSIGLSV